MSKRDLPIVAQEDHVFAIRHTPARHCNNHASACVTHTSAYGKAPHGIATTIRQRTRSAYVSIRQHTSAYISIHQHTSAYVSIRQHTFWMRLDY